MNRDKAALLNALRVQHDPGIEEEEHWITCGHCGQSIDLRRLGDVLWHEEEVHERLPVN